MTATSTAVQSDRPSRLTNLDQLSTIPEEEILACEGQKERPHPSCL